VPTVERATGWSRALRAFSLRDNLATIWRRPAGRQAPVDGMRALSMFTVIATHVLMGGLALPDAFRPCRQFLDSLPGWAWVVWQGEKSLDTFFVISGFLIGGLLLSEHERTGRIDVRRFYMRRYLRLTPTYAVAIVCFGLGFHSKGGELAPLVHHAWTNILYVNNFVPWKTAFMDWTWSLAVEEQFYMLLPLFLIVVFFRVRRRTAILVAAFFSSLAVDALVLARHPHLAGTSFGYFHFKTCPGFSTEYLDSMYVNLYTRYGPFVLGILLAHLQIRHDDRLRRLVASSPVINDAVLAAGAAVCVAVVSAPVFKLDPTWSPSMLTAYTLLHRHFWSAGISLMLVACLYPSGPISRAAARFLSARSWYVIAQLSYSTYLFHGAFGLIACAFMAKLLRPDLEPLHAVATFGMPELGACFVLTVIFSFAFGTVMYLLVERPFINLRR
jgi:peptidoglycan/LPS O-acetylase OafA/YrhL